MDPVTLAAANAYAESLALNGVPIRYPDIDPVSGRWRIFSPASGAYIDTGAVARGISPRIDAATKNWLVWDDNLNTFVNSGIRAEAREVDITADATYIKSRYTGDAAWNIIVALEDLKGRDALDGQTPELQVSGNTLQYKYPSQTEWTDIFTFPTQSGSGSGIEDAPKDGNMHGRKDGAWVKIPSISNAEIQDIINSL
jgi:hypothetical protein